MTTGRRLPSLPIVDLAREGGLADALRLLAVDPGAARASMATGFEHPDELPDELVTGFLGCYARSEAHAAAVQAYVAGMDNGVTVAIRDDLARFRSPTLIVWGTGDDFFDVSWSRLAGRHHPGHGPTGGARRGQAVLPDGTTVRVQPRAPEPVVRFRCRARVGSRPAGLIAECGVLAGPHDGGLTGRGQRPRVEREAAGRTRSSAGPPRRPSGRPAAPPGAGPCRFHSRPRPR